jgi:hypothetical protein
MDIREKFINIVKDKKHIKLTELQIKDLEIGIIINLKEFILINAYLLYLI